MDMTASAKYEELKRSIYLTVIPIFCVINVFYFLMSPNINVFMERTIPPTCVLLIVLWICFYKRLHMYYIEIFCVLFTTVYHIIRVRTMAEELTVEHLNIYMFWSPIYYMFIYVVLERKKAMVLCSIVTVVIIATTWQLTETARAQDVMVQYYTSTVVYMLVLFYFRKVVSAYIESDLLAKHAYYDALTNLGNRRSIDRWLDEAMQQSTFSLIYFDIDHFKRVNDVYGHDVGDQVLKETAVVIAAQLQPNDYFGRWGGEEFLIVCTNRNLQSSQLLANALRAAMEAHHFQHVHHVTASFGVAQRMPSDNVKAVVKRADEALYTAKKSGRNTVVCAQQAELIPAMDSLL